MAHSFPTRRSSELLMAGSRFRVIEETIYDNWNGGTYGHGVFLYLPVENFARIDIDEQADIARGICADLNKLATSTQNEHFRSEEHTSELQSLMRISYAVFCLKKKPHHTPTIPYHITNIPFKSITQTNNTSIYYNYS